MTLKKKLRRELEVLTEVVLYILRLEMDDNYILCIQCKEFVLEFCSLHGPPLIIPDSKLSLNPSLPSIPRAALTIPNSFLHIGSSNTMESGVGVFSSIQLTIGIRFGPYRGVYSDTISSMHCWRIHDTNKPYIVDGGDPNKSNWMRYVNCSRHFDEQNLIAYQQNGHIYYCTIKSIPAYTELLVFYGSEFAQILNIDLKKYNEPKSFIGTTKTINAYKNISINNINETYSERKNDQKVCSSNTNQNIHKQIKNYVLNPDSTKDMFSCDICGRKFNLKKSLTRHKRSHLSIKRFKCNYCDYESNENYALTTHVNGSHTKEVAYACNACCKVFYVKKNYQRHQRLHLNKFILN